MSQLTSSLSSAVTPHIKKEINKMSIEKTISSTYPRLNKQLERRAESEYFGINYNSMHIDIIRCQKQQQQQQQQQ
uniref:Uncharacterized protein n=1 Tax=Heterorhabditis bacteriophora TaxID=37862 RepID=A0A1I7WCN0_HETBA